MCRASRNGIFYYHLSRRLCYTKTVLKWSSSPACLMKPRTKTRVQIVIRPAWSVKFVRGSATSSSVKRRDTIPHRSMNERLSLAQLRAFCNHLRYARGQPPADFVVRQQRGVERGKIVCSQEASAGAAEAGRAKDTAADAGRRNRNSVSGDGGEAPTLAPRVLVESTQKRFGATSPAVTCLFYCRQGMVGFRGALSPLPQTPS